MIWRALYLAWCVVWAIAWCTFIAAGLMMWAADYVDSELAHRCKSDSDPNC